MALLKIKGQEVYIDDKCYPMVKLFNEKGLTTKYSCEGHNGNNFSIIFDQEVKDEQIEALLIKHLNKFNHSNLVGKFTKWCRPINGEIKYSWMYSAPTASFAERDYKILTEEK